MRFFMFYSSIIFQKHLQVYPYSSILVIICCHLGGGGYRKKNFDVLGGGDPEKKWKFSNFHPSPPLINNERSFRISRRFAN